MKDCFTTRPEEHRAANKLSEYLGRKTAKDIRPCGNLVAKLKRKAIIPSDTIS